jgi:hypothetical protein
MSRYTSGYKQDAGKAVSAMKKQKAKRLASGYGNTTWDPEDGYQPIDERRMPGRPKDYGIGKNPMMPRPGKRKG